MFGAGYGLGCDPIQEPDGGTPAVAGRPDRVGLVTIDTLRADHVGKRGAADAHTPQSDTVAAQGVRFAAAISPVPLSLPAHASPRTALDPPGHGVRHDSSHRLDESLPTLAERMRDAGSPAARFVARESAGRFRRTRGAMSMSRGFLDSPWPYFVGAGLLAVLAIASQFEIAVPSRTVEPPEALRELANRDDLNVVFLLIDTLRADRLGTYGYERPTSSVLDALSSFGIVFETVVAQSSWTKTSMASLWTGTHPINNGILRYKHALPPEATLPAELFQQAGYRTVGLWRNGWVEPNFGFGQGFEIYLRPAPGAERARIERRSPGEGALAGTDEDLTIAAIDFIENFGQERFFLYMHYMDIHQYVYDEAASIFGTSYSDAYDQAIHWTDRLVGALVAKLEEQGVLDRTLIAIASDHGEAFLEHGYEGHARNLYSEVTHVPFIILPPFLLEPGIRVEQPISNADIWPTLLDIAGMPPLPGADGVSMLPLILDAAGVPTDVPVADLDRPIFAHLDRGWGQPKRDSMPLVSVTYDGRRLIASRYVDGSVELYDHGSDPMEQSDLYSEEDPEAVRLLRLIETYEQGATSPWGIDPTEVELDEMRLNHLRALGYVIKP